MINASEICLKKVEHFHDNKLFIIYMSLKVGTKSIFSEHL